MGAAHPVPLCGLCRLPAVSCRLQTALEGLGNRAPLLAHPRRLGRRPCALGAAHVRASSEGVERHWGITSSPASGLQGCGDGYACFPEDLLSHIASEE